MGWKGVKEKVGVAILSSTQGLSHWGSAWSRQCLQPRNSRPLSRFYGEGWRDAGWFRLVKKRCGSDGTASYSCLKGSYKDVSVKLWGIPDDKTVSNNKSQLGMFKLDIRKDFWCGGWGGAGSRPGYPSHRGVSVLGGVQDLARQSVGWPHLLSAIVLLGVEGWTEDF